MVSAFQNNEDIHAATAAKVFGVPLEEVTREQRSNAKTVNFGIIYGVSAFGLSQQTNLNRAESKELIETYYATYPKLRTYIQDQIDFARDQWLCGYRSREKTLPKRHQFSKCHCPRCCRAQCCKCSDSREVLPILLNWP